MRWLETVSGGLRLELLPESSGDRAAHAHCGEEIPLPPFDKGATGLASTPVQPDRCKPRASGCEESQHGFVELLGRLPHKAMPAPGDDLQLSARYLAGDQLG